MIKIELETNTVAEMMGDLKSLLATLTGATLTGATLTGATPMADKPTPAKATPAKSTPAKPTPAKKPEPEPEPEPEHEPEQQEEDDLGLPEPAQEYKLEDAVSLAQDFVAKGKSAEVRKALNAVAGDGARIGGLHGAQIGEFIAALKG